MGGNQTKMGDKKVFEFNKHFSTKIESRQTASQSEFATLVMASNLVVKNIWACESMMLN